MDEDIDIEEHDIMENPIIKQIFPDLSVLKKEIEYTDEIPDQPTKNVDGDILLKNANMFNNKMSIGSKKPKKIGHNKKNKKKSANVKVLLKNIRSELINNRRFCQICLTLFPTKAAFNDHQLLFHKAKSSHETQPKHISNFNNGNKKLIRDETFDKNIKSSHEINSTQFLNEQNTLAENGIDEINVMEKINDAKNQIINFNSMKPCFHCSIVFPSQQSLIDHLYEILYNNNSQKEPKLEKNGNENDPFLSDGDDISQNEDTEIKKSKNTNAAKEYKKIKYLYKCPICSYYFDVEKFYSGHLLIKHKLNKKMAIEVVTFDSKCKFCTLKFYDVMSYNTHLRKSHRQEISKKGVEEFSYLFTENKVLNKCFTINKTYNLKAYKNYQRNKTYELERNVTSPLENLRGSDDNTIIRNLNEVRVMILKIILFKCFKCDIHFLTADAAKNHFDHSKILKSWKCTDCQKLFKQRDANLHKKQHEYSKYFTVEVIKNLNNQQKELFKCPTCTIHFKKDNITEHICIWKSIEPKLVEQNMEVTQENHKSRNHAAEDSKTIDTECARQNPKKVKTTPNAMVINDKNSYKQFFCCHVCKCSIPKTCKRDHINFNCKSIVKYVCEFCGLLFSNEYINAHRQLHQTHTNLKLHDFMLYDLENNRMICPISEFPNCKTCEKYFIYEYEVENHQCNEDNYLICPKCKIKLSYTAYVLHAPFHDYIIRSEEETEIQPLTDVSVTSDSRMIRDAQNKNETQFSYLCKNCDIALNAYDEVIEHCHSHNNLNKIEVDTVQCTICKLKFVTTIYSQHKLKHKNHKKEHFKCFSFDVLYFGCHNDEWIHHVFGSLPKNTIDKIIKKSIYKFENRIKMTITQNGSSDLTIYICGRCQNSIDCSFIFQHMENCRKNSQRYFCKTCNIPFLSKIYLHEHEKDYHNVNNSPKSYRIVTFNREQDRQINYCIANILKYYVLHECRYCHIIVDKNLYEHHECNSLNCQNCNKCGLLLKKIDYDMHVLKHKQVRSFNKNAMKVVLIGNKNMGTSMTSKNDLISMFSGIVCDYKLYKCIKCDVCVRDLRSVSDHYCLIEAAKFKCPICDFVFDEGKLKGHLKLHETDPDFTKDSVMIETFGHNEYIKYDDETKVKPYNIYQEDIACDAGIGNGENELNVTKDICVKIYQCQCDLHFLDVIDILEHLKKCSGIAKNRQIKQNCFKCGLTFTRNILYKHLLKHHGDKNNEFKYEIIENITLAEVDPAM